MLITHKKDIDDYKILCFFMSKEKCIAEIELLDFPS